MMTESLFSQFLYGAACRACGVPYDAVVLSADAEYHVPERLARVQDAHARAWQRGWRAVDARNGLTGERSPATISA